MDEVKFKVERYDDEGNMIGYVEHCFQTEGCLYDMLTNRRLPPVTGTL